MEQPGKEFYEKWALHEFENKDRASILKWKAVNLANLVFRAKRDKEISTLCEIGGAEGTVLYNLGSILDAKRMVNYELSTGFCVVGREKYPDIEFINSEFTGNEKFDLIIMSDIIEHIQNDEQFLDLMSKCCRFALIKIPIEECITKSDWYLK